MSLKTCFNLARSTLFHQHSDFTYASPKTSLVSISFLKSTSPIPRSCIHESHSYKHMQFYLSPCLSKRRNLNLNLTLLLTTFLWDILPNTPHAFLLAEELELQRYTDSKEGFTLLRPSSWTKVDKAGATVLFQEANMGSNNIGIVVSPVRLSSLGEFGSPQFVADKLLQAERRKSVEETVLEKKEPRGGREGEILGELLGAFMTKRLEVFKRD